ncbi:MAG: hypothetical protein SPK48_01740 [Bullifex sp.]|nr:hypothetical protein [Spirochaetales bacterium]MDY5776551.1 hypothetical protein [Bullifex sp.]
MGTFRRNRLVPLLTIHGNLETFNRNVMLPLSDAYRMDDEHYLKGRTVRELFEEDRKCMRPLPSADFRVCRVDTCTAHDGLVRKTKAWRNSIVREQMEDGFLKDLIDGLADENEKSRLFYCLYQNRTVYR